ncbi:P1 family peptidase [Planococcus sp. ISL-109]|uniref:DmpA family aminopeptidase n=1 Tax=Planococcus sp. ISL-109 TaxID=2819166 RepID=UPI001BE5BBAE|nr:P1 family peptidase [Planococcus sp. ISL-109]MBT2584015.1 P1 family peptidase [Planococcus sp. ISL-109]
MQKGKLNSITDVPGVKVGHVTLDEKVDENESVCTGVTAILPHTGNWFEQKVPAASFVLNGFGKTAGLIQVDELGVLESPIMLTNTFSVAAVLQGTMEYMLAENPAIGDSTSSLNLVVGECNDSYLNSMRRMAVEPAHAAQAIQSASTDFEQGSVGAGKGMICYGVKGGIGSSSRIAEYEDQRFTTGVLALTNFGRKEEIAIANWQSESTNDKRPDGSVIIIAATDAPLDSRQLKRLAKRAAIGLGRTGTHVHNGSGDIIIAFSTAYTIPHKQAAPFTEMKLLRDDHELMAFLFQGVIESTEEAVYQSLFHADTTVGRMGRTVEKGSFP